MEMFVDDLDDLLEDVLLCNTEREYQRTIFLYARSHGWDVQTGKKSTELVYKRADQILRRRANRYVDYVEGPRRTSRCGLPWTWAEKRILEWAKNPNPSESKAEPTPEYLSDLFMRTPEEIYEEMNREPHGMKGLF